MMFQTKLLNLEIQKKLLLAGVPVILNRISFSGELGYEIYTAPQFQLKLFEEIESSLEKI